MSTVLKDRIKRLISDVEDDIRAVQSSIERATEMLKDRHLELKEFQEELTELNELLETYNKPL